MFVFAIIVFIVVVLILAAVAGTLSGDVAGFGVAAVLGSLLAVAVFNAIYERGQIDQASGVATVTLTTQPNGESRWEPTTKASK